MGKIDKSIISVSYFRSLLSVIVRTSWHKFNENINTKDANNIINLMNLIPIYRTLHSIIAEYTLLSSTHGIFT